MRGDATKGSRRNPATAVSVGRGGARERSAPCPTRQDKRCGLCNDDMQEQGVSKILTINLNDMAKELKIQ